MNKGIQGKYRKRRKSGERGGRKEEGKERREEGE